MIAALYVHNDGVYSSIPEIEIWDSERDARRYQGPYPVVAHPPCARWCRQARLVQAVHGHQVGDDGGTFKAALNAARMWGGVLEHPAWSIAWGVHNLPAPPAFGWHLDFNGGWSCEVAQVRCPG